MIKLMSLGYFTNPFSKFIGLLLLLSLCHYSYAQEAINPEAMDPPVANVPLLVWANEAIIAVYTYDFANYRGQLQQASNYFTAEGWQAYIDAFSDAGILDVVRDAKYVVSAVAIKPPIIVKQGVSGRYYRWEVEMPVLVHYVAADKEDKQELMVTVTIVATKPTVGVRGLGIVGFSAEEYQVPL